MINRSFMYPVNFYSGVTEQLKELLQQNS